MQELSYARLDNVRLSRNPHVKTIDFEEGLLGKASVTEDEVAYVVIEVIGNATGTKTTSRTYLAAGKKWPGPSPSELLEYLGTPIPGKIVTLKVKPYLMENEAGNLVSCSTYTTFVMSHETDHEVFAQLGYTVLNEKGDMLAEARRERFDE